ncbi:MAG: DNA internalization-related competence protein ComEC/Rec2, partial [Gemmatimonadales bacterium]
VVVLMLLVATGALVASTASGGDARCARDAIARQPLLVVVADSIAPGGYARGRLARCGATPVSLSVERGEASAGSTVLVRGLASATQRGLLVQHAAIWTQSGPPLADRIRASASAQVDRLFAGDAPLVRALLLADRSSLSPELRGRFAAAGLAHILAIAGLHIGIIALALELALRLAGVPRPRAMLAATAGVICYVLFIGAPIPAIRSAAMLATLRLSQLAQRPSSRWAIVALGAAQPVFVPRAALEVGYQLSVVGVTSMIAASRLARRVGVDRLPWWLRDAAGIVLGTTVVTICSGPIVAWVFGRVSLVAPLSNVAATPLIALAQPMIMLAMIVAPVHPLAALVVDAVHPLLAGLDRVALVSASLPAASVVVAPTMLAAAVAGALSIALLAACVADHWHPPAAFAAIAAALLVWLPLRPERSGLVELHMIDVGQGDAIALRTPHGHWVLFDAGRAWRGGDAGRATVLPYLGRQGGGPLDLFVLSHPHTDHVGGAASVLHALHPAAYVDAGFPGGAEAYRASLDAARAERVRWVRAHPDDSLMVDGVSLRFLAPDSVWTSRLDDPNLASVVALVRFGEVRMLLMGDAERPEEEWLLEHEAAELHADILKVGHHGSGTSSSEAFLHAVHPRLALVSVGAGNSYHLPTPAIMHRLAAYGAQVLRTDRLGTIVARTDGEHLFIEAAGDAWELPPQPPERSPPLREP